MFDVLSTTNLKVIDSNAATDEIVHKFLCCHALVLQMKKDIIEKNTEIEIPTNRLSMLKKKKQKQMKRLCGKIPKRRRPKTIQKFKITDI